MAISNFTVVYLVILSNLIFSVAHSAIFTKTGRPSHNPDAIWGKCEVQPVNPTWSVAPAVGVAQVPEVVDTALTCELANLEDDRVGHVTSQAAPRVARMSVACSEMYHYQRSLTRQHLAGFTNLQELTMEHCKIKHLSDDAFHSLGHLQSLALRTRNSDWSEMSMKIDSSAFFSLKKLKSLDLSTNNIQSIPQDTMCHMQNLITLNISNNAFHEMKNIGFSTKIKENNVHVCGSSLTTLDMSHNAISVVPAKVFSNFDNLQHLLVSYNELINVEDDAFQGLSSLVTLDISNNLLIALPQGIFVHIPNLRHLRAGNNSLSVLPPHLFQGLELLQELDLSYNNLQTDWRLSSIFQGLSSLQMLDLSHNKITHVNQQVFSSLTSVKVIHLNHNHLQSVPENAFSSCVGLLHLDLSNNKLTSISDQSMSGLQNLKFLTFAHNSIANVGKFAFSNLSQLQDLNLNSNKLRLIPSAVSLLENLETIDIGENMITSVEINPTIGLQKLYGLRLINNLISGNITRDSFVDIPSLKILNLAGNKISQIESNTFRHNSNLQAIRLDSNMLTSIDNLFGDLSQLKWLNLSDNSIETFDYDFIPLTLEWLDLKNNQIYELHNDVQKNDLSLKTLDVSFNNIFSINQVQIPESIEHLTLNNNRLSVVEPFTFFKKINLSHVDLSANFLTAIEMSALRLAPFSPDIDSPIFYLSENPFICNCHMEWLQSVNAVNNIYLQFPKVADLDDVSCRSNFARTDLYTPLLSLGPSDFLCEYDRKCSPICNCCEYDTCDCEMKCPDGCRCYHDQTWDTNIVDCSVQDIEVMPKKMPSDTTHVYVDGNDFQNFTSDAFVGLDNIKAIYANNSNIQLIGSDTLASLSTLTELHLDHNNIKQLFGMEFAGLTSLKKLYLHNNKLWYIHQHTFANLIHLEVITLHDNSLTNFPVWRLVDNSYLNHVSLKLNQWSCDCQFIESFTIWISGNKEQIIDEHEIRCFTEDASTSHGYQVIDLDVSLCVHYTESSNASETKDIVSWVHPILSICFAFVMMLITFFCVLYRHSIRDWVNFKLGEKMSSRNINVHQVSNPEYDAFILYSSKDEGWVNKFLMGELEYGENSYRLCLQHRDLPVTENVPQILSKATQSSNKTLIVLSNNFLETEWCYLKDLQIISKQQLIIITAGDMLICNLDGTMQSLLKTSVVIHSSDEQLWQKLRIAVPKVVTYKPNIDQYATPSECSQSYNASNYNMNSSQDNLKIHIYDLPPPITPPATSSLPPSVLWL